MNTPSLREANGKAVGFTPLHPVSSNVKTNSLHQRSSDGDVTGFTLLELLIVIGIMVILGTVLILVLNPAETLKKSRDNQRISDLATMKTALGLYVTDIASPDLDAAIAHCFTNVPFTAALISYSKPLATDATCLVNVAEGADVTAGSLFAFTGGSATDFCRYTTSALYTLTDGTGWVPVNLGGISGGTPISNMPIDPTNTVAADTTPVSTDLVYRYACQNAATTVPSFVFELNAQLESTAYTSTDDKRAKDGGDNTSYYEVGNSVKLIGTGTNF